jgi:hypothetical protein
MEIFFGSILFIVPEEETADEYPNSRIIYLKLSGSITGWNPHEELLNAYGNIHDNPDDMQVSIWETIVSDGWASVYWPCYGAIMQVGVYPRSSNDVPIDDYPEIMDFEPKKRELYEQVTEGDEILSASSTKKSTGKSTTNSESLEITEGFTYKLFSADVGITSTEQRVHNKNTDKLREDRETKSHSTSFSQMYQLFNGYHLGTNRALFVVAPRPHTKSSSFVLIDESGGGRVLEGIQDVFLVINLPKKLDGFCVQASIDTGHKVMASSTKAMQMEKRIVDDDAATADGGITTDVDPIPSDHGFHEIIVTRRTVKNCGKFDDNGNFTITGVPTTDTGQPTGGGVVIWEGSYLAPKRSEVNLIADASENENVARQMNIGQRRFIKSMISGISAGNYDPVEFTKTRTFRRQINKSLKRLDDPVNKLLEFKYIAQEEFSLLTRSKMLKVGDIFDEGNELSNRPEIIRVRKKILDKAGIQWPSKSKNILTPRKGINS